MRSLCLVFALILMSTAAIARDYHSEILSALKHLETSQALPGGPYEPGQWPTNVTAILAPSLLGAGIWGKPYPEPTIFTTATIVSVLRQIQDQDPSYESIGPMIDKAVRSYKAYEEPPFYNFYPLRKRNGAWVRGPRSMYLAPYMRGLANIPPDADSTSVAYLSLGTPIPKKVLSAFAQFRDVDRKSHYYNREIGLQNTGAFMTWLMDEKDPNMPHKTGHPELGPRIPFGTNDIDCIVNANVLNLLTSQKQTSLPGYQETCDMMKTIIDRRQYGTCGIYYPSDYLLAVRAAELKELGGRCLLSQNDKILWHILSTQHPNGSWSNSPPNRPDRIHSTALALTALMLLGDRNNPDHRARVARGVEYLLKNSQRDKSGNLYWKGQVFFSAVAQARFSVVWRSSSYTTVLTARALQLAEDFN